MFATFLVYHAEGPDVQCNAKQTSVSILIPMTSNGLTDIHTSAACSAAMSVPITSLPYFGVKLSCVCLMFAYRKNYPITYSL